MSYNHILAWRNHYGQPHRRKGEDLKYEELMELFMLTVARLDTALAANDAKDKEVVDLKGQITVLQGQVVNVLPAEVVAKVETLVTALAGPEVVAPAP